MSIIYNETNPRVHAGQREGESTRLLKDKLSPLVCHNVTFQKNHLKHFYLKCHFIKPRRILRVTEATFGPRYRELFLCFGIKWSRARLQCLTHRGYRFNPWSRKILWRRKWQPTPVFLLGKSHGQRSLEGYSPWGQKESDTTEQLSTHTNVT